MSYQMLPNPLFLEGATLRREKERERGEREGKGKEGKGQKERAKTPPK